MFEIAKGLKRSSTSHHSYFLNDIVSVLGTQEDIQQRWVDQKLSKVERRGKGKKASKDEDNTTKAGDYNNRGKRKQSKGRGNWTEGGTVLWEKDTAAIRDLEYVFWKFYFYYWILHLSYNLAIMVLKVCHIDSGAC